MSTYFLVKDGTVTPTGLENRVYFADEELERAKEFLDGRTDFNTKDRRGYFGQDKQYVGFAGGGLQVQVQCPKLEVITSLVQILQPKYYVDGSGVLDDKSGVHPISEFLQQLSRSI